MLEDMGRVRVPAASMDTGFPRAGDLGLIVTAKRRDYRTVRHASRVFRIAERDPYATF